jgi:hypothetical protein
MWNLHSIITLTRVAESLMTQDADLINFYYAMQSHHQSLCI